MSTYKEENNGKNGYHTFLDAGKGKILSIKGVIQLLSLGKHLNDIFYDNTSSPICMIISEEDGDLAKKVYEIFEGDELLSLESDKDMGVIGMHIDDYYVITNDEVSKLPYDVQRQIENGYLDGRVIIEERRKIVQLAKELISRVTHRSSIIDNKSLGGN